MNLYSHLVVACDLEEALHPVPLGDFYLGAIVPDIRYYCEVPRRQTHLPLEQIAAYATAYPHLQAFVLGYLIHCRVDELSPERELLRRFPFRLIKRCLPAQFAPVLLEFYFMESTPLAARVSETGNAMLDELGIDRERVAIFAQHINHWLAAPSLERGTAIARDLGLLGKPGVEKYLKVAQMIHRHVLLRRLLFAPVRTEAMRQRVISDVLSLPIMTKRH